MRLNIFLSLLIICNVAFSKAEALKHYKNINAIASYLCSLDLKEQATDHTVSYLSQFSIDKTRLSMNSNQELIELSGTCNMAIRNAEVTHYGNNIEFSYDPKKPNVILGKLGLMDIKISFIKNTPHKLKLIDSLLGKEKIINLSGLRFATNNSIVTLKDNQRVAIKDHANRVMASESLSKLQYKAYTFYNIWSYNSYGCSRDLTEEQCLKAHQSIAQ